ncbi:MAG: hypothetical protein LAN84_08495 [Acidobacteriia bacterium]|nr:hypothetical protein [Terriglobia bacterium]
MASVHRERAGTAEQRDNWALASTRLRVAQTPEEEEPQPALVRGLALHRR